MHRLLYPREKSPWYPSDRWLGGPWSRSGHEEVKIRDLTRTQTRMRLSFRRQPVATPTALSQILEIHIHNLKLYS
jgi:hypothetical protein